MIAPYTLPSPLTLSSCVSWCNRTSCIGAVTTRSSAPPPPPGSTLRTTTTAPSMTAPTTCTRPSRCMPCRVRAVVTVGRRGGCCGLWRTSISGTDCPCHTARHHGGYETTPHTHSSYTQQKGEKTRLHTPLIHRERRDERVLHTQTHTTVLICGSPTLPVAACLTPPPPLFMLLSWLGTWVVGVGRCGL